MGTQLDELRERAARDYSAVKERRRRRYKLAKELGFSPTEAQVLAAYSEARIVAMMKERMAQDGS